MRYCHAAETGEQRQSVFEQVGMSSPGFTAPFGVWNTELAKAIDTAIEGGSAPRVRDIGGSSLEPRHARLHRVRTALGSIRPPPPISHVTQGAGSRELGIAADSIYRPQGWRNTSVGKRYWRCLRSGVYPPAPFSIGTRNSGTDSGQVSGCPHGYQLPQSCRVVSTPVLNGLHREYGLKRGGGVTAD